MESLLGGVFYSETIIRGNTYANYRNQHKGMLMNE